MWVGFSGGSYPNLPDGHSECEPSHNGTIRPSVPVCVLGLGLIKGHFSRVAQCRSTMPPRPHDVRHVRRRVHACTCRI